MNVVYRKNKSQTALLFYSHETALDEVSWEDSGAESSFTSLRG